MTGCALQVGTVVSAYVATLGKISKLFSWLLKYDFIDIDLGVKTINNY